MVAPVLEAHIAQTLFLQKQTMARKWERLCFLQRQITQLQKWMAGVFPSTAIHFVHQQPGIQVETIGDALEVKLCKPILNYRIVTTRRIKSTCYPHFPIKLPYRNDLFFENIWPSPFLQEPKNKTYQQTTGNLPQGYQRYIFFNFC